uniref:Uncharacterized protein n=1 Tax=Ralstonia solanacearum TaxID=305 RepID=A0A0S4VFD7_RALSL|nr:protein of unknown function [Ralstonia solanacearum]
MRAREAVLDRLPALLPGDAG